MKVDKSLSAIRLPDISILAASLSIAKDINAFVKGPARIEISDPRLHY